MLQDTQIFACHFISSVYQICFGKPLKTADALLIIGDGLHRFKDKLLGCVHHPQVIIGFGSYQRNCKVIDKRHEQPLFSTLAIVKHAVGQLPLHP